MSWLDYLNINKGGLPLFGRALVAALILAIPISFAASFFEFSYDAAYKVVVSVLAGVIVGYIFKENRTAIDKIRNYDYSKFNIKKKELYSARSNTILMRGGDKSVYNILYYSALILIPIFTPKPSGIAWLDTYTRAFLGTIPIVATVFYLIFFNERKSKAEKWIAKLDEQKRIEEHREKVIEKLRKAVDSHEKSPSTRSSIELADILKRMKSEAKVGKGHKK